MEMNSSSDIPVLLVSCITGLIGKPKNHVSMPEKRGKVY